MLDKGSSAFGDETVTIRFATLENPEIFGRMYQAGYPDEVVANLPFLDGRRKKVKLRRCGLKFWEEGKTKPFESVEHRKKEPWAIK